MSIGKSQAAAIADGFLDNLATDKVSDLQPKETYTEIILLAGELAKDAQDNLARSNSVASGKLSESIAPYEPVLVGGILKVEIPMNFYGLFVNKGVKGTKGGASSAGYAFTKDGPSKAFIKSIEDWMQHGKLTTANTNANKSISRNEVKNASISQISSAYAIARSIMQKGIKGTGFLDKAITTTRDKVADRIGTALEVDILNAITQ